MLYSRMGHLVLFNVMAPDGPYRLDFSSREESIVAQILIHLAIEVLSARNSRSKVHCS